jgi:hypothetical protein
MSLTTALTRLDALYARQTAMFTELARIRSLYHRSDTGKPLDPRECRQPARWAMMRAATRKERSHD